MHTCVGVHLDLSRLAAGAAWGTLRLAGAPLFGRKIKAFMENTYSLFFVRLVETLKAIWSEKIKFTAFLLRSHKVTQGHVKEQNKFA